MQLVQMAYSCQSQSPTEHIAKVAKSASIAWSMVALQAQKIAELEASNKHLQEKKKRTKKQLQHGGVLTVGEAWQLILEHDNHEILATQQCATQQDATVQHDIQLTQQHCQHAPHTCSCCGSLEHTACTCNLPSN